MVNDTIKPNTLENLKKHLDTAPKKMHMEDVIGMMHAQEKEDTKNRTKQTSEEKGQLASPK